MIALHDFIAVRAALRVLQRQDVSDAYIADLLMVRCLPPRLWFAALRAYRSNDTAADRAINRIRHALYRFRRYELAACALRHFNQIDIDQLRRAVQHALDA